MSDETLDRLLRQPLARVEDHGFSARVIAKASAVEKRRALIDAAVPILGLAVLLPFLPLQQVGDAFARITPTFANSAELGIAIAALILSLSLEWGLPE